MKLKKFIEKLRCTEYVLWLMRDYSSIYDGDLKEFITIYSDDPIYKSKIKWFYFVKDSRENHLVIQLKEDDNE